MDVAHQLLVLLHLVAFAALLGGALVQLRDREPEVNAAMLHGSWLSLASGVALWVLASRFGEQPGLAPMIVKLALTLVVSVLVVANRRYLSVPRGLLRLITLLVLGNAVIAVLWR